MIKKLLILTCVTLFSTLSILASADGCVYNNGNPLESFKNCSPTGVIKEGSSPDLEVTDPWSDFMELVKEAVNLLQKIAFYFAVGIIVWLGAIMVLPANAEAKEATKSKLISVLLGFLAMISATIIVNILINFIYDILS